MYVCMIFVVHEWVTTKNGVCWTSLCSYSFFFFFLWLRAKLAREVPQNRWLSVIGPYKDWQYDLLRRELYNSREGDWDFFSNKKTKICNLGPRVISAQLKMSRNDPGLEIEKKKTNSKKITNQIHINALLTKWKINLAGYWPSGEFAIHKKNLHANYFF